MRILPAPGSDPLCLSCSPDSRVLYVGCQDGTVLAWDRTTDAIECAYDDEVGSPVLTLACSADGKQLALTCSRRVLLHDLGHNLTFEIDQLGLGTGLVAFGSGGRLVYTAHAAGWLRGHLANGGRQSAECSRDPLALAARPDAPWIVLGHGFRRTGGATWWRFGPGGFAEAGALNLNAPVAAVAVSPRGDRLALGTRAGMVSLLDPTATGPTRLLGSFRVTRSATAERDNGVFGLAFTPDGRELLTAGSDGDVQRWDVELQRLRHSLDWEMGALRALVFAPDGQTAAAIAGGGRIVVWDMD